MNIVKLGAVLCAGAFVIAAASAPARAASPVTNAFLANVTQNVDFLDRSSRFALNNSKSARLKEFAHSEAREQTLAANAMDEWIETNKAPLVATTAAPSDEVQTGRSVAVDGQVADNRLPLGQEDLDSIEGLNGQDFDAQYKEKQLNALNQVRYDYEAYIAKGDDPALIKMATRELPKIKRRIAQLSKI